MRFLCTPNALNHAEQTHTNWIIAMAMRIDFPDEHFQVWEFKRVEPGLSALVVTDGDGHELHKMTRPNAEFDAVALSSTPEATTYWVVRSKDDEGNDVRTLLRPEDY